MGSYYVKSVKKEWAGSGAHLHKHLVGVYTGSDVLYANQVVADSIAAGHKWYTEVNGEPSAEIEVIHYCPGVSCYHRPYLRTVADRSKKNNLENLPER